MDFAQNLMRLRKERGLSQEALGEKIGVARQTVSKWETGETTPELNKLIELARLFGISIDELTGVAAKPAQPVRYIGIPVHYEYVSRRKIRGLPLVHINLGLGIRRARGIIAIGNIAQGVIAIGGVSVGLIAVGGLGIGLICLGALALGLLAAVGGAAAGALAVGGLAAGLISIGGVSAGVYAIGGVAMAHQIAAGGYASGAVAIGEAARGAAVLDFNTCTAAEIEQAVRTVLPHTAEWIVRLFSGLAGHANVHF